MVTVINWPAGWLICLLGAWYDSRFLFDLLSVVSCKVRSQFVCFFYPATTISTFFFNFIDYLVQYLVALADHTRLFITRTLVDLFHLTFQHL